MSARTAAIHGRAIDRTVVVHWRPASGAIFLGAYVAIESRDQTENFWVDESWLSRQPVATESKSQLELSQKLAAQEKDMIEAALRGSGGRVFAPSGAAAKLGIHRSTLESKIASLKIDKYRFKTASASKNSYPRLS